MAGSQLSNDWNSVGAPASSRKRREIGNFDAIYRPLPVTNQKAKHVINMSVTQEIRVDAEAHKDNEPIICESRTYNPISDTASLILTDATATRVKIRPMFKRRSPKQNDRVNPSKPIFPIFTDEAKFRKNEKLNQSINFDNHDSTRHDVKVKSPEVKPTKLSPKVLGSFPNSHLGHQTVKPLGRGFLPSVLA